MNFKISYEPNVKELVKVSSLFAEKKPFLLFTLGLMNIFVGLFLVIFVLKLILIRLSLNEWLAAGICGAWLFGRRPLNEWILYQKMKHSVVLNKTITIEVSRNGIVWSGKGLRAGNMGWEQVKYVLEAKNGFIVPNSFTKFLWLPFRGFAQAEDIEDFRKLIVAQKLVHRVYPKWVC